MQISGWGTCTQRYRQVDVLRKINDTWNPTTVVAGACCDCKVRAGTEIHQLVIGNTEKPKLKDSEEGIVGLAFRQTVNRPLPVVTSTVFPSADLNLGLIPITTRQPTK